MEHTEYGWAVIQGGKIQAIADSPQSAETYALRHLVHARDGDWFKWTDTHKLYLFRRFRARHWTGVEIVPAPLV